MKTRRSSFAPVVLALLVALASGLVWGGAPAHANTLVIPISGTVDALSEAVVLTGQAEITSTLVPIEEPGTPRDVILRIKLVEVSGLGLLTGKTYVAPGENILVRPLVATEELGLYFPFFPSGSGGHNEARSARTPFSLVFDTATGDLTGATATITNP